MSTPSSASSHGDSPTDPYAALRVPGFRLYISGNFLAMLGMQMQSVAVGWEIYRRTGSKLALGYVGLVQFLPVLLLALPAGQLADRFNRKRIVQLAMICLTLGSLGLASISWFEAEVVWMYGCLLLNGIARAAQQPSKAAMLPQIVPRECFSNAVTWNSSSFQLASILGPGLAGILIALFQSAALIYLLEGCATLIFLLCLTLVRTQRQTITSGASSFAGLAAGFRFVWKTKIILAALTLDLFAVLLGGATTLLPVFAEDVLNVESALGWIRMFTSAETHLDFQAIGLGWMQAAPALGALLMSVFLTHQPPMARAGRAMLLSVVAFGVATIIFGVSRSFWLSISMLLLLGAFDMVSVVVRHTLVQMRTPDEMRGRVSAVNGLFIGASNQLGGFESGVVAHLFETSDPTFGPMVSVVSGGVGTLLVVLLVAFGWPEVRRYGRLNDDSNTS